MALIENHLLAHLPMEEYGRLLPSFQWVTLSLGEVVYESGGRLDAVYFPTTSVVSLLYTTENGSIAEMGLVGNDGVVGVALFLGGETTPNRAVVQLAGYAWRMSAKVLREEFARGGPFQHWLLRYTQALLTQISQTAVCNRLHSVEQRLSRWLLLIHDRTNSAELPMSQEFISSMLVLLCYKRREQQKGQWGSWVRRERAIWMRRVAMEAGLCRSARSRRAAWFEIRRKRRGA